MPDRPAKPREYLIVHWVKGALFSHHNLQCGIKSDGERCRCSHGAVFCAEINELERQKRDSKEFSSSFQHEENVM